MARKETKSQKIELMELMGPGAQLRYRCNGLHTAHMCKSLSYKPWLQHWFKPEIYCSLVKFPGLGYSTSTSAAWSDCYSVSLLIVDSLIEFLSKEKEILAWTRGIFLKEKQFLINIWMRKTIIKKNTDFHIIFTYAEMNWKFLNDRSLMWFFETIQL